MSQTLRAHLQFPKPRFPHAGCAAADRGGHSEKYRPREDRRVNVRLFAVFLVTFALCGASLSLLREAGAADDGNALLAKHRAFVGWTFGDGTFTSLRSTTKWHPKAKATPSPDATPLADATPSPDDTRTAAVDFTTVSVQRGALYRSTNATASVSNDNGFTGRVFWDANENGFVVTVLGDRARRALSFNMIDDEAISTLPGTLRGSEKLGDTDVQIVRVKPDQGSPVDLYVDATGAYRRFVISPDSANQKTTVNIDRYIEALPGKKVVGEYHYGSAGSYVVEKVEANVPVADADLQPPPPRATWTFGEPAPVPIEIIKHSSIVGEGGGRAVQVRASINGHEGTFLLDSGASELLLFSPFADSLGLKRLGGSGYSGVNGGFVRSDIVRIDELKVGNNTLHDVIAARSRGGSFMGVDGILGYDFLARALIDVDTAGHTMMILDPAKYEATIEKTATAFPVDLTTRQPGIQITVGNGAVAHPIFDTGDDFLVLLSDTMRQSGKIAALSATIKYNNGMEREQRITFGGVDGGASQSAPCVRLTKMMVGPYPYENGEVCFGSARVFGEDGGLVGFDFLRHFNWTFDYTHGRLILTPNGIK